MNIPWYVHPLRVQSKVPLNTGEASEYGISYIVFAIISIYRNNLQSLYPGYMIFITIHDNKITTYSIPRSFDDLGWKQMSAAPRWYRVKVYGCAFPFYIAIYRNKPQTLYLRVPISSTIYRSPPHPLGTHILIAIYRNKTIK